MSIIQIEKCRLLSKRVFNMAMASVVTAYVRSSGFDHPIISLPMLGIFHLARLAVPVSYSPAFKP
jgi:hypothetical protein